MISPSGRYAVEQIWPLTGRATELAASRTAVEDRACRGILIRGRSGVGKTRLAGAVWQQALDAGHRGGRATATAAAAAIPLGAVAHLLPPGLDLADPPAAFHAVAASMADAGGQRYHLLVDDLHLLDSTSAMLIGQLLDSDRVFLISTLRSDEPLSDAVAALDRTDQTVHVGLGDLDRQEVETVLAAALGGVVERRTGYELHRYSGGNLLYLRELVVGLLAAGTLVRSGGVWRLAGTFAGARSGTPRLHSLVRARLDGVGEQGRKVLETLAAAEPISLSELARRASTDVLAHLEAADLIHVHGSERRTSVTLSHPLYGEVLRGLMPVSRRREILADCAERVLAQGARRLEDTLRVATWQLGAAGSVDPDIILQAARLARHGHDYPQVVDLLERLAPEAATQDSRLQLGEAYYLLGRFADSERVFAEACDAVQTDGELFRVTVERTQNLFWGAARAAEAIEVNTRALGRTSDSGVRDALLANEGAMRIFAGQPREGLDILRDIERVPDERVRIYATAMKVLGLSAVGRTTEAVALGEQAYDAHVEASRRIIIQHPSAGLSVLSLAYAAHGDLAGSRRAAERGHHDALADNAVQPAAWLSFDLGRTAWLQGRIGDAYRWFSETLAVGLDEGIPLVLRPAASGLAASAAVLGLFGPAESALADHDTFPDMCFLPGEDRLGPAWLLAARGRSSDARRLLFEGADRAADAGYATSEMLLLTEASRLGGAKQAAGRLAELAATCDGVFAGARARFAHALAAGDGPALLAVAEELESIGALLLAAEAAAAAACVLRQDGGARAASAAALRSTELAARCQGATTPGLMIIEAPEPLSGREREVAVLAAGGAPSRDIAADLHLSVRTVDNHLQRVFGKLGVTSRRQLAGALGLLGPAAGDPADR
ncbi:helix-turn-helix transcriptional regulator [Kitasatospora sp. NPDC085879]|uniref:helix-turn-helix transcriptional regulator n=1 Tax=Kitasatospora sp. NPDC085879 TaxID=3154769 RepID=UPI003427B405